MTTPREAVTAHEQWQWQERQPKYNLQGARVYEFYGLDWWFPLWDRRVVDCWASVPLSQRAGKQAYKDYITDRYAAVTGERVTTARGYAPGALPAPVERAGARLVGTPIESVLRPVYRWLRRSRTTYDGHPLAWFELVPRELFENLYSGRETVHSLRALEAVGRASFADGTVTDPPHNGALPLPYEGEASPLPVRDDVTVAGAR